MAIIDLTEYFCADDGIVASNQPERLQRVFYVLTGLFGLVGLWTNTGKTVSMVSQPCHAPGRISEEAYKRRTTGLGPKLWEKHRRMVECP